VREKEQQAEKTERQGCYRWHGERDQQRNVTATNETGISFSLFTRKKENDKGKYEDMTK